MSSALVVTGILRIEKDLKYEVLYCPFSEKIFLFIFMTNTNIQTRIHRKQNKQQSEETKRKDG